MEVLTGRKIMGEEKLKNTGSWSGTGTQVQVTLDQLKPGNECRIRRLRSREKTSRRLLAMGVYPGMRLRVVRYAPLHDPVEVEIEGRFFSLRRDEARFIEVDPA
jgi:ferrous iron transport protein A